MTPSESDLIVAIVGAGAMGAGIAQVAATAGHPVLLYDVLPDAAVQGVAGIRRALDKLAARSRITEDAAAAAASRIHPVSSLAELARAGLVIEAIVEDAAVKQRLFATLEAIVPSSAILATNTSSLSITLLAKGLAYPDRVAGFHFFNPAPAMKLVELVSGLATSSAVIDRLEGFALAWGKSPVRTRSTPGFIVNRVARPFYGEAWRLLEENAADAATIDGVLREVGGFRMGPFELMDMIGHDVNFAVTCSVFAAYFGDPRYRPSIGQAELVAAGWLGRKSGRGVFDHSPTAEKSVVQWLPVRPAPSAIEVEGDLGPAETLIEPIRQAGIRVSRSTGPGIIRARNMVLALGNGQTATQRAAETGSDEFVQFDLASDYASCAAMAIAVADQSGHAGGDHAAGLFQAIGKKVVRIDDVPGMIVLRTVAMIANEAADVVQQRIASPADVDLAMQTGVNYPLGPIDWTRRIGAARVAETLVQLHRNVGDDRYRASTALQRGALSDAA